MYIIDNTDRGDVERTILWQYDKAESLVSIISSFKGFFKAGVTDFWDSFISRTDLSSDENLSDYGLALWGKAIGVPRLTFAGSEGVEFLDSVLYRNLLKARLVLSTRSGSLEDYREFISSIFGDGKVEVVDKGNMSLHVAAKSGAELSLSEQTLLDNIDTWMLYPAGVKTDVHSDSLMFGLDGQQTNTKEGDPNVGGLDESSLNWRLTLGGNWND